MFRNKQQLAGSCQYDFFLNTHLAVSLWCLTPLSTISHLYRGCQFYWWRKPEYLEKTTDQLYHILLHRHERSSNSQRQSRYTLITQIVVNPTTIRSLLFGVYFKYLVYSLITNAPVASLARNKTYLNAILIKKITYLICKYVLIKK